ncbi:hypothetical protein Hanom_Chr03g00261841 [Helianthus anomalus]
MYNTRMGPASLSNTRISDTNNSHLANSIPSSSRHHLQHIISIFFADHHLQRRHQQTGNVELIVK